MKPYELDFRAKYLSRTLSLPLNQARLIVTNFINNNNIELSGTPFESRMELNDSLNLLLQEKPKDYYYDLHTQPYSVLHSIMKKQINWLYEEEAINLYMQYIAENEDTDEYTSIYNVAKFLDNNIVSLVLRMNGINKKPAITDFRFMFNIYFVVTHNESGCEIIIRELDSLLPCSCYNRTWFKYYISSYIKYLINSLYDANVKGSIVFETINNFKLINHEDFQVNTNPDIYTISDNLITMGAKIYRWGSSVAYRQGLRLEIEQY